MTARQYRAVIESGTDPKRLVVIATGSREHCTGAIAGWKATTIPGETEKPLIVVEVAQ